MKVYIQNVIGENVKIDKTIFQIAFIVQYSVANLEFVSGIDEVLGLSCSHSILVDSTDSKWIHMLTLKLVLCTYSWCSIKKGRLLLYLAPSAPFLFYSNLLWPLFLLRPFFHKIKIWVIFQDHCVHLTSCLLKFEICL